MFKYFHFNILGKKSKIKNKLREVRRLTFCKRQQSHELYCELRTDRDRPQAALVGTQRSCVWSLSLYFQSWQ